MSELNLDAIRALNEREKHPERPYSMQAQARRQFEQMIPQAIAVAINTHVQRRLFAKSLARQMHLGTAELAPDVEPATVKRIWLDSGLAESFAKAGWDR